MNRYTIREHKYDTDTPMARLQELEDKIEDGVLKEVRHGTWYHGTQNGIGYAHCSACGTNMNVFCYGYAYCCLCGARIENGRKERRVISVEKQIEEMAKDIEVCDRECVNFCHNKKCKECQYFFNKEDCYTLRLSQMLVAKGYRKNVAREIFEEIDDAMIDHARGDIDDHWLYVRVSELKKKHESEGEE